MDPHEIDMHAVAAQVPVAWSIIDLEGNQVLGNETYAELFGRTVDEMRGIHVQELTHPDDRDRTSTYLAQLVSGEMERYETDKRYQRADGSEFTGHLVASLLCDDQGQPLAFVGAISDVTEQRSTAERLALSEERLTKMLTNISDTITLIDAEATVVATTGFHKEILGYESAYWQTATIFDLLHADDAAKASAMQSELLDRPNEEIRGEVRVRHASGHYEFVEVTGVNLIADPAVGAVVLTTRNVTDRKKAELELASMRDQALALAERRANFVANVSHELRTPLHAVLGLSELLEQEVDRPDLLEMVLGIQREAERLRATVDDLLDVARFEAEGISLERGPVDIEALIQRVVHRASAAAHARELAVRGEVADSVPPWLQLVEHRVEQVLTNLVGNAVKFTEHGEVVVSVDLPARGRIRVEVRDTGPGIPVDQHEQIFEPFRQVEGQPSAVAGSGLGLALVRNLVRAMEGTVALECPDEGGARFIVELPAPVAEDRPSSVTATTESAVAPRLRVLVVEDNEVNQLLVRQQLDHLGHLAEIVSTGMGGLALLKGPHHRFDVVLMDWQLPDIDGLDATRRLRVIEAGERHVPVIAMTASAMPEDQAACRDAGMDDFLPKPVGLADLRQMLARWGADATSGPARRAESEGSKADFDPGVLDGLVSDLADRSLVESLVDRFLLDLDERERLIIAAATEGDVEVVHRVGHTLRSTSQMLGAVKLGALCRDLEKASDSTGHLNDLVATFARTAEQARTALVGWRDADRVGS